MEYKTIAGNYYTITSKSGCSVTDATGTLSMTVDAGGQLTVQAPSDKLVYDDEQAIVFKANFKHALAALSLLGGGDNLPSGYTRLAFLESTGEQYIDFGVADFSVSGMRVECELVGAPPGGWSILGGGLYSGTDLFSLLMRNAKGIGYQYGSKTEYPTTDGGGVSSGSAVGDKGYLPEERITVKMNWLNEHIWEVPECNLVRTLGSLNKNNSRLALFARYSRQQATYTNPEMARVFSAELSQGSKITISLEPVISPDGVPCMFDRVSKQPFRNAGTGQFIAGFTLAQARKLGTLPAGTTLTVSLPVGWLEDEGIVNAIAQATANGCVITQAEDWSNGGSAASSSFALRRVWVRKTQDADGSYVDADNTRWQVEWCVDVWGADPETLGYERFRSVDAATEYWELVPYEYPEEELSTIDE